MNFFCGEKPTGEKTREDRRCTRCDAQPGLVLRILDPAVAAPFACSNASAANALGATKPARPPMKLLTEYLDRAINLECLAASEQDPELKTQLLNQAAA
jgi:hypothetical protein